MRRSLPALLAPLTLALIAAAPAVARAAASTPSLPVIERQLMCVSCKIPLNVAESPQADRERHFVASLITEGRSEAEIKRTLVAQYGTLVLALPSTHGIDLAVYLVPIAAVLCLLGALALLLPRWRRRARASATGLPADPLSPDDAERLDADMARFD